MRVPREGAETEIHHGKGKNKKRRSRRTLQKEEAVFVFTEAEG